VGAFGGIEIRVSAALVGHSRALRFGNGPLIVSPAMYDLISHADEKELRTLLENIHIQQLPAMPNPWELPMTTRRSD
jgi:hypothetical protein